MHLCYAVMHNNYVQCLVRYQFKNLNLNFYVFYNTVKLEN